MKVSREQAEKNREVVLTTASRRFRELGVDGASVAGIFAEAGLTHGALYVQFPGGKESLASEAIARAFAERRDIWEDLASTRAPAEALAAIVESYVSAGHRDEPGAGCPTPLMGAEAGRRGGAVRTAYTDGVRGLLDALEDVVPGESADERRRAALRVLSTLAGAMLVSRAVDDPTLSDEVLAAARTSLPS
ncbi:TetR/AcrR family transcriptional regulator [Actinomycetospora sp. NBRC 106378]|uniref:TetR/AcrR family transcriptional regulator n=1 Tax=Actinomycetospora sp. NBRC 106378 TaxID=3032208 RepID=UPI0024A33B99|nr:TetR/AcrR family transcriptional regulator [Actinomycetospora sp. NBRC 106378]GLZ53421.1 TetR family transcriptional regulator [Actinomycetospora sp. NBRC 106378]